MQYRKFGNTGFDASILGFGCMRLPMAGGKIDEKEAIKMIRTGIDNGINYIDTAYIYHGGESEVIVGKALKDGYREKVKLATKMPTWLCKDKGDYDKLLEEQLKRLDVEHIDFYLLHSLSTPFWNEIILKYDYLTKSEQVKQSGKVGHIGFSFHDDYNAFKTIVDGYDKWEFCQIQLNYLNEEYQQGLAGLKYAAEKDLPVIIMEPLLGGKLAAPAKKITSIFEEVDAERTPVEWALDYLWNMPEVTLLLSGMSTMEQVEDNLKYASRATASMLSEKEVNAIKAVQAKFKEVEAIPCTKCGYCMPCPVGLDIPRNFDTYNSLFLFENDFRSKNTYELMKMEGDGKKTADNCIACKKCEQHCPQKINISGLMPKVHETLSN